MTKLKKETGGWLVRVKTPPASERLFYVYELDWTKAQQLVRTKVPLGAGETIDAVGPATVDSLAGFGMTPGEVKQFD